MKHKLAIAGGTCRLEKPLRFGPEDSVANGHHVTYVVNPVTGDDANPPGKPWRTFVRVNALRLVPGDRVEVHPGVHAFPLKPSGGDTAPRGGKAEGQVEAKGDILRGKLP